MKALIAAAVAAAFALPAFAQNTTLPNAQERAENREKVQEKVDRAQEKLPSAEERAQNREKTSNKVRASALTGKVKSALAKEEGFRTLGKINVDSNESGVVTLKGKVESAEAKKKAEQVAKQVDGVKSVKNQLQVEKKG